MEPLTIGYLSIAVLVVFLAAGLPVAAAMGLVGVGGMFVAIGDAFAFGQLRALPFEVTHRYAYAVLPLFVLMGTIAGNSGITADLFRVGDAWLRRFRGGLYMAVIFGSAMFAAVSGSTVVNAILFTRLAFPEMLKYGYSRSLSIGSITATGSFAAMIPPSITMVLYAILCEQSVGQLLIAGIIPGILTALVYCLGVVVMVRFRPALAPSVGDVMSLRKKLTAMSGLVPVALIIFIVMGGIYGGFFPPTSAGAVGASGAFALALWRARGRFAGWLRPALSEAASISCIIFTILIGGLLFSRLIVVTGVVDGFVGMVTTFASTPVEFMIAVAVFYLLVGCFLDTTSMMIVTLPFIFPPVVHYEIDPIWFGIVLVKLIEIAVVTPPVGLNLFAVMSVVDKETTWKHLCIGVTPFILLDMIVLAALIAWPELATWLPQRMIAG